MTLENESENRKELSVDEDVEKLEHLFIVGRSLEWYSYCGKQFDSNN